jgi:hypothetical protein
VIDTPNRGTYVALRPEESKQQSPLIRDYKLADEKGLYLLVKTNGGKYWRLKYRIRWQRKADGPGRLSRHLTGKLARSKRDEARALLANGIDPMGNKRAVKAAQQAASTNSFEIVANEWLSKRGETSEGNDQAPAQSAAQRPLPVAGKSTD